MIRKEDILICLVNLVPRALFLDFGGGAGKDVSRPTSKAAAQTLYKLKRAIQKLK